MYNIILTTQAVKDAKKLKRSHLRTKAAELLQILRHNPFQTPPPYEKLAGLELTYSRRINDQHRLVYQVLSHSENETNQNGVSYQGNVRITRMWTHYE